MFKNKDGIQTLKLADENEIPLVGLGTWQLTGKTCQEVIKQALDIGYRHIDTAEAYGNEEQIGNTLKDTSFKREEFFITSKLWPRNNLSYEDVLKACETSLKKLQTDYLDLYLLHWPNRNLNLEEVFKAVKELQSQGKIKSFGVSNFTINHLKDAIPIAEKVGLAIVDNQVEFHPYLYQKELRDFCKKNKIVLTAYSPLARGKVLRDSTIKNISQKNNLSPSQVSLIWLLQKNMVVIPKASSKEHLKQNFALFNSRLSEADIEEIDKLNKNQREVNPSFSDFDY